jgi:membrane protein YdbS with pleckstrin-like domain
MVPPNQRDPDVQPSRRPDSEAEQDLWAGRISAKFFYGQWAVMLGIAIVLLIGGIALRGAIEASWPIWAALLLIGLGVGVLASKVLYLRLARRYRLTTQRLFMEEGILIRTVNQTDLIRVKDVSVTQKLLDRLFNVGSVTVNCPSDVSNPKILILGVEDPHQVAEHIHREMRALRDRKEYLMEAT